jgi:hypothetical protein
MAVPRITDDHDEVHNGPLTQPRDADPVATTSSLPTCCGSPLQVVGLTRGETAGGIVELVRCASCGTSAWQLDGRQVSRDRALGALSAVFASTTPRPAPRRVRPAPAPEVAAPAPDLAPAADLVDLLAGWQVFGATT